jgi:hypothetical protein
MTFSTSKCSWSVVQTIVENSNFSPNNCRIHVICEKPLDFIIFGVVLVSMQCKKKTPMPTLVSEMGPLIDPFM